ncbi:butyrophilin subfamily 3 member A2-like [Micropterus dolomieu]|uniref:butyrophilin subfamily 3 member A2-like n=1 Tax=Micropterus dolomieu TaxID=147949 RepID=UPI001E8DB383|nr:butyrophilin subfamily 3 member A2-like [Micropterus dolomieu]
MVLRDTDDAGHSQLIGSPRPIVAKVGDDVILPFHLQPAVDVAAKTFEWARPDLNPRFVYVWRAGQDIVKIKNPSYKGRTTLFTDELKHGNISLKLSKVKLSDEGRYKCYIPDMNTDASIELVVGAVSSPVISLAGIDRDKGGVVLQCESAGWYPEPEVFWLDGEGNLLSAGPTETFRGPDDLYTVSSRVTVEKRHSNSFTCRVQQKDINQTRDTHIQVPDDFFEVQSSLSPITVGLAVCLVACIMIILLLIFSVWKWRQNIINCKRSHRDETDEGEQNDRFKSNKTEVQVNTEAEREQLMTDETVPTKDLKNRKGEREKTHPEEKLAETEKQLQDEKRRREEAEKQRESIQKEVEKLKEEKQRSEDDKKQLQKQLATKTKEPEEKPAETEKQLQDEKRRREEAEKQRESIQKENENIKEAADRNKEELKETQEKLEERTAKNRDLKKEVKKLKEENQRSEDEKKQLQKQLATKTKEVEKLKEEKQRSEDDKKKLQKELETKTKEQPHHEQKIAEEAEKNLEERDNTSTVNQGP